MLDIKPHQHAYVECELKKILQLYRPVLMMTINYRFICRSKQLGLCYSTTWKILWKHLDVKPFKIQLVQELKPNDLPLRRIFGEWGLGKLAEDPLLYRKFVFSDKAHFWLNEYVNKQNYLFWSEDQSEALQKLPVHIEKVTVWCDLLAGDIIGPYIFNDAANRNVTVNGERYLRLCSTFSLHRHRLIGHLDRAI